MEQTRPQTRTVEEKVRSLKTGVGAPRLKEYAVAPYSLVVTVQMPSATWPNIWYSWLSLKGHLQSFHDIQSTHAFASRVGDDVIALFAVVSESADSLAAWLREGYSVDQMLREMGVPEENFEVRMMRDFS